METTPRRAEPAFLQTPPELGNQYDDDRVLGAWLRRALPADPESPIRTAKPPRSQAISPNRVAA